MNVGNLCWLLWRNRLIRVLIILLITRRSLLLRMLHCVHVARNLHGTGLRGLLVNSLRWRSVSHHARRLWRLKTWRWIRWHLRRRWVRRGALLLNLLTLMIHGPQQFLLICDPLVSSIAVCAQRIWNRICRLRYRSIHGGGRLARTVGIHASRPLGLLQWLSRGILR